MKKKYYQKAEKSQYILEDTGQAEQWQHSVLCTVHSDNEQQFEDRMKLILTAVNNHDKLVDMLYKTTHNLILAHELDFLVLENKDIIAESKALLASLKPE